MLTERRIAQFGLVAAFTILIGSMAMLLARDVSDQSSVPKIHPGIKAPEIGLKDTKGREVSLSAYHGERVVLCFDSPHYPAASTDYHQRLVGLSQEFGVKVIEIQSDAEVDSQQTATVSSNDFLTLLDRKGRVTASYDINVSPTFVLVDQNGMIRYRGALDDNTDEGKVSEHYLADALRNLNSDRPIGVAWVQAFGRPIK